MRIRELKREDSQRLRELVLEMYDENPAYSTFDARPSGERLLELMERKLEGIASGNLVDLVAEEGGDVVAECELVGTGTGVGVMGILVGPGSRRRGIGRRLVSESMERASLLGITKVYANVSGENKAALSFFAACGFRAEGEASAGIVTMSRGTSAA